MIPKGRVTNLSGPLVIDLYLPLAEEVVLCVQVIPSVDEAAILVESDELSATVTKTPAPYATDLQYTLTGSSGPDLGEAHVVPFVDVTTDLRFEEITAKTGKYIGKDLVFADSAMPTSITRLPKYLNSSEVTEYINYTLLLKNPFFRALVP